MTRPAGPSPAATVVHLPSVASTMDVLDDLIAAGAAEWTVVLADVQTAGLGRAGRRWEAEPGTALLCSVLARPTAASLSGGMLAIGAGVAIAEMLADIGVTAQLKWPNDVLLGGRKLGGILVRSRVDARGVALNVGVGLNLRSSASSWTDRASLAEVLRNVPVAGALVPMLVHRLSETIHDTDESTVRDSWTARSTMRGEEVVVEIDGEPVVGRIAGLDVDGALLLDVVGEATRRVVAGDLVRGPRLGAA